MTGDKHRGGSAQTQSWIHTTSISPAALSSCSLRHYLSHIYGHGWTKATALVMISGTDIVMTSGCFSLLPLFSTFVADPTQKVPIWWRDQCAPPRLYHRRFMKDVPWYQVDSRPPSTQIPVGRSSWLSFCPIITTSHWSRLGTFKVHFTFVHRRMKGYWLRILTSFNCIMVIHTCAATLWSQSPTQRQ